MKRIWLILLLISLFFFSLYYYRFYQTRQSNELEGDTYNQFTGKWEKVKIDSKGIEPSKITNNNNSDGLYNYAVVKGYFDQYDDNSQILKMRVAVAFTQNSLFELADLKLSPNQTIYCVPEVYTDPNTGKSYSLQNLRVPVKDGATIFVPGEKMISFTDFVEQSNQLTFILVQLAENFDKNKTNYVQKIIVTNLCD